MIQCTNVSMNYQHLSFDPEYDSLSYSFADPINDLGAVIPFAPGYTTNSPMPGVLNLNPFTGQMEYTPTNGGYFVLVTKVAAYKCGVLVSEIFREINVVLNNSCPQILQSGVLANNQPPIITAPFADPVTGLTTSFSDTVFAGDTVDFVGSFYDFEWFTNSNVQSVTLNTFGTQYGAGYTDPNSGCLLPPCATLSNPTPYQSIAAGTNTFNWVTAPIHLGLSMGCVNMANTYHFIWKANDNYCPANASNSQIISITVMPNTPRPVINTNGSTFTCSLTGNYSYQWYYNRFAIPGATSVSYTPTQTGTYHVLAVQPNGDGNYSDGFVYNPVGLYEPSPFSQIVIAPNPSADGRFAISGINSSAPVSYIIQDMAGRVVMEGTIPPSTQSFDLDVSNNGKGVYTIFLKEGNRYSSQRKLVRL